MLTHHSNPFRDSLRSSQVLDFIGGKPTGLLAVLDEACLLRATTDLTFCSQIYKLHPSHPRMHATSRNKVRGSEERNDDRILLQHNN